MNNQEIDNLLYSIPESAKSYAETIEDVDIEDIPREIRKNH